MEAVRPEARYTGIERDRPMGGGHQDRRLSTPEPSGYPVGIDRAADAGALMKIENSSRCEEMRILA